MKLLMTGIEWDYVGNIGPDLRDYMESQGHTVVQFIGDIRDRNEWIKYDDDSYDFVIHLAARPNTRDSFDNPDEVEDINVNGTKRCMEFCKRTNTKLMYASTSSVAEWWLNPYAMTKKVTEHLAEAYGIDCIGFRFHNIWPGRSDMIYRTLERGEALPFINVEHYRDFTHIEDLSSAILLIMNNFNKVVQEQGRVVDIGTGKPFHVYEVIKHYWKSDVDIESVEKRNNELAPHERQKTKANVQYLYDMGWEPKHEIMED